MKRSRVSLAADIAAIVLSLLLTIGTATFAKPCAPKEDGSWMNCHWAAMVAVALGIVMTVQTVCHLFSRTPEAKRSVSIAILPTAVLAVYTMNGLVHIGCGSMMRCQTVTKPLICVVGGLLIVVCVIDIVLQTIAMKKDSQT